MNILNLKSIKVTLKNIAFVYNDNKKDFFESLDVMIVVPYEEDKEGILQRALSSAISILIHETKNQNQIKNVEIDYDNIYFKE